MAKKRKRPASRGSVNKVIMQTLLGGQKYGLEIIKEVEEETDGKVIIKQPSLYSALSRFKAKGYVTSYWEDSPLGGKRHYYNLTPLGHEYYKETFADDDDDDNDEREEEVVSQPTPPVSSDSEPKANESSQHRQKAKTEKQSQEFKMEFDANKSTNKPSDDEVTESSSDGLSNTEITSDNFHSHIQNKIKKLLEENGSDNADDIAASNKSETGSSQQADSITTGKPQNITDEESDSNLTMEEVNTTDADVHEHAATEIITNNQLPEGEVDDIDAEEVEIAEEIYENNIHIQPITALNSYREFGMDNTETEEISDRLKGLKNLYNEIKTQTTKIEQATKSKKTTLNKPLSLIERQKREASIQKLYGPRLELNKQQEPTSPRVADNTLPQTEILPTPLNPQQHLEEDVISKTPSSPLITKGSTSALANHSKVFHASPKQPAVKHTEDAGVKKKVFTVDENGIMKLEDNLKKSRQFNKVIDNVVFRSNNYGNNISAIKTTPPPPTIAKKARPTSGWLTQSQKATTPRPIKQEVPLSPAEREERIKQFERRFESLTNAQIEKKKNALSALNILESLYKNDKSTSLYSEPNPPKQPSAQAAGTTTIEQTPTYKRPVKPVAPYPTEQDEDVDFDYEDDPIVFEGKLDVGPKEKFLNKNMHMKFQQANKKPAVNTQPEVSENYSSQKPNSIVNLQREMKEKNLLFKTYSNEDFSSQPDVKFLLANKIKFAMGWIFLFLMLVELTAFVFILQRNGMLYVNDYIILQSAYVVVFIVALLNILPFIFNKNKRKANNFKFSYSLFLGVFALALVAVMAYAISTFMGMTMENINFFLVKLLTPLILAVNFILAPIIYRLMLNRKTFY